jgi:dienelactone hydrolase
LTNIDAAIAVLRRRQDVAPGPVLISGQSRGGLLSVAYVGMHPEQTLGIINFVGGCPVAEFVNQALFARGGRYDRPTIWLYGQGDHYYSIAHSKKNFAAFEKAGGQGKFFKFAMPGVEGHDVVHDPNLWSGPIGDYLNSLSGER